MTSFNTLRRIGAPLASAVGTALLLVTVLWVQHARGAWPFEVGPIAPPTGRGVVMPAADDEESPPTRVPVEAAATRSIDIRLEPVMRQPLVQAVRAVATVVPDESRISHVHTRVAGWIEQLHVNTTGAIVRAGQPLAQIFSQELLSSQVEYLTARRTAASAGITTAVVGSGRTRLTVLGMSPAEIDAIEETGQPKRLVTVIAPRAGVVVDRGVTVGTSVDPSTTLVTIADLSRVWVLAEVPEVSIAAVRAGTSAELDFPASGRTSFRSRVDFVYPTLTERTRTLRVRLSAPNLDGSLKPGLYGTASFEAAGQDVLTVPRDAVVDTGVQQHVFVAFEGRFEPRPVVIGTRLDDRVEIRSGLREGEQIVAAGVFLLDSESRLRATGGAGGHRHGGPAAEKPAAAKPPVDPHAGHKMPEPPAADPHATHRK